MSLLIRLRVEVADVPGSLARAAAIIADHGGNITAIDVQRDVDSAVDEITVELPDLSDLPKLRRHLAASGVAQVVSFQSANSEDLLVRLLRRLTDVIAGGEYDPDTELRRGVAELCSTPAVWISDPLDAAAFAAGRAALTRPGEAQIARTAETLPHFAGTPSGDTWLMAIAGPTDASRSRVVFVARPITKRFTVTESSRVEALVGMYAQVDAARFPQLPA